MTLQQRTDLLVQLGKYMQNNSPEWQRVKAQAATANPWFIPEFIEMSATNISNEFLQRTKLEAWIEQHNIPNDNARPVTVGIVMARQPAAGRLSRYAERVCIRKQAMYKTIIKR